MEKPVPKCAELSAAVAITTSFIVLLGDVVVKGSTTLLHKPTTPIPWYSFHVFSMSISIHKSIIKPLRKGLLLRAAAN